MKKEITREYLLGILEYDKFSGLLTWIVNKNNRRKGCVAGSINSNGYVTLWIDGKQYQSHRVIWFMVNGNWPIDEIDHIDGIRTNNAFNNLREATRSENSRNHKVRVDNNSGVKGVYWNSKLNKWRSEINFNKKRYNIGYFKCLNEAEAAVKRKREELHLEFARHC
jgi:HNH endonuclease/AP2 domain